MLLFILIFKLGDAAMGFMVKPFWVDAGFTAAQIGLVSVNIGLALSIAGGIAGGWITDASASSAALWILGLVQAVSNLGYGSRRRSSRSRRRARSCRVEHQAPLRGERDRVVHRRARHRGVPRVPDGDRATRTAPATEYALLSSVFALSRSVAGWAGGLGAQSMGYGPAGSPRSSSLLHRCWRVPRDGITLACGSLERA